MIRSIAAVAWMLCGAAQACGGPSDTVVEGKSYTVAYRTAPAPIAMGEHFALEVVVCPRDKAQLPRSLRVDAGMPEHKHGMNYRPTVTPRGGGRYRVEGMLFHMSGRWEIAFDLAGAAGTERITSSMVLE
ncbi:MAG: FixH family protein [Burkholderiales bacterium]